MNFKLQHVIALHNIVLVTFAFIGGLILSAATMAESLPRFPFLMADGRAEIKVKPDIAKVSFNIMEFSKDPKEAKTAVIKRGRAIVDLANKLGIENDYITSTEYNKNTRRKQDEDHYISLEILGYEISQSFTVEIRNIAIYSRFVDQLLSSQNIEGVRTEFSASNEADIGRDLVRQATADAKRKAIELADGMGVKLGPVFAFSEERYFSSLQAVFGIYPGSFNSPPPEFISPPSMDFVPDYTGANMFVPKAIEFSRSVSVIFKIK